MAIRKLREAIGKRNGHLSIDFVAASNLLTTLCDLCFSEEADETGTKRNFPGWFDMVYNKGNSVMKENWEGTWNKCRLWPDKMNLSKL